MRPGNWPSRQGGAVIIMVLWTSVVLTIMVTVLASNVRLSATTAWHNRMGSEDLSTLMSAMNRAEMELMMERMPPAPDQPPILNELGEVRIPAYRFNGQPLSLHYPAAEHMVVRIYDHAGKINLNRMPRENMRQIIQKRLGPGYDPDEVEELLDAWTDWTDQDDAASPRGAEDEYYLSLDPPYRARNHPELDSVEELRLVRGFDELFADFNLDAAFTVYGSGQRVNLNLATREAMQLLPGISEDTIEAILEYRQTRDMRGQGDVGEIVPLEEMVELSPWIGNNTSSVYSVFVYPRLDLDEVMSGQQAVDAQGDNAAVNPDPVTQAYRQIMEVRSYETRARVYQVHPHARLPDTSPPRVEAGRLRFPRL